METMTFNENFVLLISLVVSGFLLCATKGEIIGRGMKERGIGIHLGTTYSSVAVLKHPAPSFPHDRRCDRRYTDYCSTVTNSDLMELVPNERGSRTTPSCVAFTNSGVLIGEQAKDRAAFDPERTICGFCNLIGKRFDDPNVQAYIKTLSYKVLNIENKPHVEAAFENGEIKVFTPVDICAMILRKMEEIAEAYMGNEVKHAVVIIHPSRFNRVVFGHIVEAGKMVGLKVASVRDSIATAKLARRLWNKTILRVLVYHLGGTAFHVSLQNHYDVIASRGDATLGGQSFESRVADYFITLIKNKYKSDISKDLKALTQLRIECEKAKISLSSNERVIVKTEFLLEDRILLFEEPLTRAMFEELNMDLFNRTMELARWAVDKGGIDLKKGVDEIVLVGGNTQIPKIQQMLKELFGKVPLNDFKPDESLAFTATDSALTISHKRNGDRPILQIFNSLDVGIEAIGGIMVPFVESRSHLPGRSAGLVTTLHDGQTTVEIKIFEGQRVLTKYCHYLGTLVISDLPPAPRGVTVIKVEIEVNPLWNIRVTAEHKESQRIESFTIPDEWRYNTVEKVSQAHSEYAAFNEEDEVEKTKVEEEMRTLTMPASHTTKFAIVAGPVCLLQYYVHGFR